ncbi:hypothetical protein EPK99_23555 [Neorhizobium lilium]|uniref:Uncharacterized protein n=1 Tax=Neorhizobium lilium TaxID=2503024 RepID=A0A3S3S276_9HYPH|nr:hypothetical protein EPK99_23555 [Neorhizobium lilium]
MKICCIFSKLKAFAAANSTSSATRDS